jgi:hypothetical protein
LPEDGDVKRWFDDLAARSIVTTIVHLRTLECTAGLMERILTLSLAASKQRRLGLFYLRKGVKPKRLTKLCERESAKVVLDVVDELEARTTVAMLRLG